MTIHPLISVIIPALNAERTLSACLASIINQSISRTLYEIIVVDNGSTDNTATIAKTHGARCVYESKQNRSSARNCGIRASGAPLVAFIDSDTAIDHNWLEELSEIMENPFIGGAQGLLRFVASDRGFQDITFEIGTFKHLSFLFTGSCMYRRAALEEVGLFSEDLTRHEDVDLSFKVLLQGWALSSTRNTRADTPACKDIRISSQIEIGTAMVQIIDRWGDLFSYTNWSGVMETFRTWRRQFSRDTTTSFLISFARFVARSSALFFSALWLITPSAKRLVPSRALPPIIIGDTKSINWASGTRIVFTHSTTKVLDIFAQTLVVIEGSGDQFMKALLKNNGSFDRAVMEVEQSYVGADSVRQDMQKLLQDLAEASLLVEQR